MLSIAAGVYFNGYSAWWLLAGVIAFVTILVLGSIYIQWNFYFRSVNKLPLSDRNSDKAQASVLNQDKRIALTFDDGPTTQTEKVLDILKQAKVTATFFVIGKNIAGKEHLLQRMQTEGHTIGNHSYHHGFNFDWQSAAKMLEEITQTNTTIEAITGIPVTMFRPPYGVTNPNLAKALRSSRLSSIGWNLRSMDTIAKDESVLRDKILATVKAGDILLLHDRCNITAAILPELIAILRTRGYTFAKP